METIILVDFDGTITKEDTCYKMVKEFAKGGWMEIEKRWESGEINTEECALQTFELMDMNEESLTNLLDKVEIDDYFKEFLNFCNYKNYKVIIASDGYDFNIRTILNKYNITLQFYSNKLYFKDNKVFAEFNTYKDCDKCGSCKLDILKRYKKNNTVIFIGDGYSDICVAKYADILYAKEILLEYCKKNNILCRPFKNFKDIIKDLKKR